MFIKQVKTKNGRINIAISQSYRDAQGKSKSRVVKGLGYLDEIEKHHEDPWAYIYAELQRLQHAYEEKQLVTQLPIALSESLRPEDALLIKNFGYACISKLYHLLEIDYVVNNRRRYTRTSFNHNAILKLLVYSRLIAPGSKKRNWEQRHQFFDRMDVTLTHVYRSLAFFAEHSDALLKAVDKRITRLWGRDTSVFYYDVTNYYFEIEREDELRRRGVSKQHRPLPLVQMGLFLDAQGIPLSFKLFEGNTNDRSTFAPAIQHLHAHHHSASRYIVVSDNALFSGDNLREILINGNGFIVAYSLKAGKDELKAFAFDPSGYSFMDTVLDPATGKQSKQLRQWDPDHPEADEVFRIKEKILPFEIQLSNLHGKKQTYKLDAVKLVVTYSPEYAAKARQERERTIEKTQKMIQSGRLFGSHDSRRYIHTASFSPESGEEIDTEQLYELDYEKLAYEQQFDGFHALITSEVDMPALQVMQQYHGLWEIEETFRISKNELKTRPVFVSLKTHIQAHFLISFLSLTLLRLLDKQLENRYSTKEILENLRACNAYYLGDNIYRFYHTSECLRDLGKITGIDFTKKYMTRKEIVSTLADTKKTDD